MCEVPGCFRTLIEEIKVVRAPRPNLNDAYQMRNMRGNGVNSETWYNRVWHGMKLVLHTKYDFFSKGLAYAVG